MKKFIVIALLLSGKVVFAEESQEVAAPLAVAVEAAKEASAVQADLATLTAILEKAGEEALDEATQALFTTHPDVVISAEITVPFEVVDGKLIVSARYFRAAQAAAAVVLKEEAPVVLQEEATSEAAVVVEADLVEVLAETAPAEEVKEDDLKN